MKIFSIFTAAVIALSSGVYLQAQHLDWHGDHFDLHQNVPHGHDQAGHLTDRFGHHIDGHGNHTGSIGVFEDGRRDYSGHERNYGYGNYSSFPSHRSFSLPYGFSNYGSLNYSSHPYTSYYSNRLYTDPSYYGYRGYAGTGYGYANPYAAPNYTNPGYSGQLRASDIDVIASMLANRNPTAQNAAPVARRGGTAVLSNPRTNTGEIQYALNSFQYTIKPGEAQTIELDREWVIQFDNGLNKQVRYRLEDGKFEFVVSPATGWDIVKRVPRANQATPIEQAPSSLPSNVIPPQ